MSYCVNCGVELAPSEKKCPLCETEVINPAAPPVRNSEINSPFPRYDSKTMSDITRRSMISLITILALLPVLLSVVIDININGRVIWSGYVLGGCSIAYVVVVFPIAFRKLNRYSTFLCDMLTTVMFLFYIEHEAGGDWFMSFALPLVLVLTAAVMIPMVIEDYTSVSRVGLCAIGTAILGAVCVATELLINFAFALRERLIWSLYPLVTLVIIAIMLWVVEKSEPLKEKLRRKFFI